MAFGAITFVVGDYLAPLSEHLASRLRAAIRGSLKLERYGAWIQEHAVPPAGERSYSIHVGSAGAGSTLRQVRIFEFDADGRLLSRTSAAEAQVHRDGRWTLSEVERTRWHDAGVDSSAKQEKLARLDWKSTLSPKVVAAAVLPVTTMSTLELWRYSATSENEQAAQCRRSSSGSAPYRSLLGDDRLAAFAYLRPAPRRELKVSSAYAG